MTLANVLASETGFTLVTALIGSIWAAFKSSDWRRRAQEQRYAQAVDALEAAVESTYQTYVREIKNSRADGKLTDEEMREARRRARGTAVEFGTTRGIDVVRELGAQYIDVLIAKLVKGLKG